MAHDWRYHDPHLQRLATRQERSLSTSMRQSIERAITRREGMLISRAERNNHRAFPILPPDDAFTGPILMGHTPAGQPVGIRPDDFTRLTILLGSPGTGKSLLAASIIEALQAHGIWILTTDAKSPPNTVLPMSVPMLEPHEAAITLDAPPGQSHDQWLTRCLHLIESSVYLSSGSTHVRTLIDELMRNGRSPHAICLAELAHILHCRAKAKGNLKEQQHLQSAATALDRLSQADGGLFSSTTMLPWTKRLTTSHGLWLRGLAAETSRVATLATMYAAINRQHHLGINDRRLHGLCVLDDARGLIFDTKKPTISGVNPFLEATDVAQSVGISVMLLIQSLAEVPSYLVNAASNLLLIGPIDGNELMYLRPRLELNQEQSSFLVHQPRFNAVLHCRHADFTLPFPLRLPGPAYVLSEAEAAQRQQHAKAQLLANYHPQRWSPQSPAATAATTSAPTRSPAHNAATPSTTSHIPASTPPPLDADAHALLVTLARHPYMLQAELGNAAGLRGRHLTHLRDELAAQQLLTVHKLSRFQLWELTRDAAQRIGVTYSPLPGRGGYTHRWLQARIANWLKQSHPTVAVEHPWQSGHLDVYARSATGDQIAYEVVLSTSNLDDVLAKLASFLGDTFIVVTDNAAAQPIRKQIAANPLFHQSAPTVMTLAKLIAQTKP
ncbi:MAG: AAA family ATPase [Phycisphaerales bacterium]|nr:MAG: AAA family ATPase [Phycisphaerales bacterium]